ncbi:MAG: hypothetical protein ACJ763_05205 [Bdellovibrionia bacterium]
MRMLGGRPMVMGVFALLAVPGLGLASQERANVTIEQRAQGSDVVVHGKVKEKRFEKQRNDQGDELIVTHVNLEVQENLKGTESSSVDMVVEGGTYEGMTLKVSDQPELVMGEEVVAFLNKTEDGYRPNRRGQGILRLKPGTHQVANSSLDLDTIRQKTRKAQQSR